MSKANITDALRECDEIVCDVMDKIKKKLDKKEIKYKDKKSEIIVSGKTLDEIKFLLKDMDDYDKIKLVVQLSCVNGNVYIRQKFN